MKKILPIIVFLAIVFRFTAVNWDAFGAFHPDERNISWAVTRITFFSQMNPKFFAYGGLPIYLYRALGEGVALLTHDPTWLADWGHIAVIGRHVSATLSTVSVVLIYLVGASYFSPVVGIVSATLLTFSPWAIREAHFETTETMLVFFLLLLLLFARKITNKRIFFLGMVWGLSLAAKTTSLLFGVIPLTAIWLPFDRKTFRKRILSSLLLGSVTGMFFFIFSPYTLADLQHFMESMNYESGVALGRFTVPYTLQFLHTTPYLFPLTTIVWQAGPLVVVGLAGLLALVVRAVRKKHREIIIFLIFPLLYSVWVGAWFAKFARYNVPFLPFVTIAAAYGCAGIMKRSRVIGSLLTMLLITATAMWGLANFTIYLRPQTKELATQWIATNVSPDAVIYTEHWNDGLPLDLPSVPQYKRELLNVYDEPDNDAKRNLFAEKLAAGDYVIFSTRRIWATMPRLQEKYPVTSLFYRKILSGNLGYKEVAAFTSYPQLFGITFNDDAVEESIQVFDHPTVRIFQNAEHLSREEIYTRLMSSMGS